MSCQLGCIPDAETCPNIAGYPNIHHRYTTENGQDDRRRSVFKTQSLARLPRRRRARNERTMAASSSQEQGGILRD